MPTFKLTDQLGLDADVTPAPSSALLQYFQQLPSLRLDHLDFSKVGGLTLDQPALTSLKTGISFDRAIPIGPGPAELSIQAGVHGSLALIKRGPGTVSLEDVWAEDVEIAKDVCYVSFGLDASVEAGVSAGTGSLTFGISPGASISIANLRTFPLNQGTTLMDAVRDVVSGYLIPAHVDDLTALPAGGIVTVTGTGSLQLSVTANLLAMSNPLASVSLPALLPTLSVNAGGSVTVNASYRISGAYQICVHKLDSGKLRLGWYRNKSSELGVGATVSEGLGASLGSTDLFTTIVGRISADPAADLNELSKANLSDSQIAAIRSAVKAAVQRRLELSLSAQLSITQSGDAIFLYEIDTSALNADSRKALDQALHGDLSALHGPALPGISCVNSVWETAVTAGVSLRVNLLGILNVSSIATLTKSGSVMYEPATGALVISDRASAQRIQSVQVNFGADTQKLRKVMAESFFITAAYQGTQQETTGPSLRSSHSYFELLNDAGCTDIARMLRIGLALGLLSAQETDPGNAQDFGRTMVHASTEYDNEIATAVFLDSGGAPRAVEFYERMGRNALLYVVGEDDEDAVRRRPALEDPLWEDMKAAGQPGFNLLFRFIAAPLLGAITADYSTIVWWADAMSGAGQRLSAIRQWFTTHPAASPDDAAFQKLRTDLAAHLAQVAANTREEFGLPWGLLAMNEAANHRPAASIAIVGPNLATMKDRVLTVAAGG